MRIIQEKHGTYFCNGDEEYCIYAHKDNTVINRTIYNWDDGRCEFVGNERMEIPKEVAYEIAKKIVEEHRKEATN